MTHILTGSRGHGAARSALENLLRRQWLAPTPLAQALRPAAVLYGAAVAARRALYRRGLLRTIASPVPVVVVGNIVVGGAGKTPLAVWLAGAMRDHGLRPGLVCSGYGARRALARIVTAAADPEQDGDEPVLLAAKTGCPVAAGADRCEAVRLLIRTHPEVDVILSDDGLQHYRMERALEIAVYDGRGTGNGWLLPAGPLRERAGRRVDFTVWNGDSPGIAGAFSMTVTPAGAVSLRNPGQPLPLEELVMRQRHDDRGVKVSAVAGIGNPQRFFSQLRAAGLRFDEVALPDHHRYTGAEFASIDADIILMTEKDAVKCARLQAACRAEMMAVTTEVTVAPALITGILNRLGAGANASGITR